MKLLLLFSLLLNFGQERNLTFAFLFLCLFLFAIHVVTKTL